MSIEDLRSLRDEALTSVAGRSLADQYERGAILLGWEGLTGERGEADVDTLRVELRGVARAGSYDVGRISTSLQNAVAYIGKYQKNRSVSPQSTLTRADRRRFEIVQEAQFGSNLVFRVPAIDIEPRGLDVGRHATVAGSALRELIATLPEADDDAWSPLGVMGAPPLVRRAVHDVSKAVADLPDGIALRLIPETGSETEAALSHARATLLRTELDNREDVIDEERHSGLLDGLRGTRRVFYLVKDDDQEIVGAVDAAMVQEVEQFEHTRVTMTLETTQWVKKNGRLGDKAYRLLRVEPAQEQGKFYPE
ncbi:hypothetical protein EF294_07345 [Gordonia oryzae]|uniref:Uncharacterized protein n=1 Tax=Gordonia oryzae TaxID=2487349 RepID=A0A3N4H246_9ACTN|nr:hypothetical protein [Gordonia oryzae]RPA64890.1 hypothetical protein EF294_07345 [Gordonia oryzae]